MALSRSAEKIQIWLREKGLDVVVVEFSQSARTANDAAAIIGCGVGQIVKSLLFCTTETKRALLILVSGLNRVREGSIQRLVGEKIVKADANFTKDVTGFAIGGIPPIAHTNSISSIYIDEDLLQYETLWAAAGTPNAVFSLSPKQLQLITDGQLVSVKA